MPTLESAIINHFRNGNVTNISQCTAQIIQAPEWRSADGGRATISTQDVRRIVFKLEKDKLLVRETNDGVTRFRWNKRPETSPAVRAFLSRQGILYLRGAVEYFNGMDEHFLDRFNVNELLAIWCYATEHNESYGADKWDKETLAEALKGAK